MSRCPNCSYELVLLSHRRKYKCALCSKLYPKKEIEATEFQEFNKRRRIEDFENYEKERKEEVIQLKELRNSIQLLFKQDNDRWFMGLRESFQESILQ